MALLPLMLLELVGTGDDRPRPLLPPFAFVLRWAPDGGKARPHLGGLSLRAEPGGLSLMPLVLLAEEA